MEDALLLLLPAVVLAFTVEGALGFGSTIVMVALGSLVVPLDVLLPVFVPVNLGMSAYLAGRYRATIAVPFLARRLLPFMALGLPVGFVVFARFAGSGLRQGFGAFLVVLSALELARALRPGEPSTPLGPAWERIALVCGGLAHGAFATGGPLAVYVTGRVLEDKAAFRSTLSLLWLVLNAALIVGYLLQGVIDAATLGMSAALVPGLVVGLVIGEWAHHRLPARAFRIGVFALLLAIGAVLATKP